MVHKGIEFAVRAHGQQKRKGSDLLYIVHPFETALILSQAGANETLICAGLLHDTLEDTAVTYEQLQQEFGTAVADLVQSRSEDKLKTWEERKLATVNGIQNLTYEQKLLLCADKLSNMRSIAADYQMIGEKLWERFRRGRESQKWYYGAIITELAQLEELPMHQELKHLYQIVFEK
ncbi:GTP pyrophosphokinase rsh [Clostridiales bacterium CHKCI001]|nr:GTP pyrophosphokinase rsh [Clostridiales bacterium CHKCI001]